MKRIPATLSLLLIVTRLLLSSASTWTIGQGSGGGGAEMIKKDHKKDHVEMIEVLPSNHTYGDVNTLRHLNSDNLVDITIKSAGYSVGNYASIEVGGKSIISPGGRGLNVVLMSDDGSVVSAHTFDTYVSSSRFTNFVSGVKDGVWVFISVRDEAQKYLSSSAKNAIKQLGSTKIDSVGYRHSWCIIGRKGAAAGSRVENHKSNGEASCSERLPTKQTTSYPDVTRAELKSAGYSVGNYASIEIDGSSIISSGGRGLNVVVTSGVGSIISTHTFDTWASIVYSEDFASLIFGLKDGVSVFISVKDEAQRYLSSNAKNAIKQLGSTKIDSVGYRHSWCIIGRKGATAGSRVENHKSNGVASCSEQGCPPINIPFSHNSLGGITYSKLPTSVNSAFPTGTAAKIECKNNPFGYHVSDETTCTSSGWVEAIRNPFSQCENSFTLPASEKFESCPSFMVVSRDECEASGLSVGGILLEGSVKEGFWSWVPFGCSINTSDGGYILYNANQAGENNGNYKPICKEESFLLTPQHKACPAYMDVKREDCFAAGLSVGAGGPYNIEIKGGLSGKRKYLSSYPDGSDVDLWMHKSLSKRQKWNIALLDGTTDIYHIIIDGDVSTSKRYLSANGNGERVDLWTHDDDSGRQRWKIVPAGDYYHIIVDSGVSTSRRYLSTGNDGATVDLWTHDDESGRQKWRIVADGSTDPGGQLRGGTLVEGSWNEIPFGCSVQLGGEIRYNSNRNAENSDNSAMFKPVCKKGEFELLPRTYDMCPSFMYLSKEECEVAGLSVGGVLSDGKVKEGSWSSLPFGCSIDIADGNYILYNSFVHGKNNGNYEPVCSRGKFTLLPKSHLGSCPSSMNVRKEDCAAAGLSVGGKLRDGTLVDGSWDHLPFGCSVQSGGDVHYNSNNDGENDGDYAALCHKLQNLFQFIKYHDAAKCPLETAITKSKCSEAGISVGGILQDNELIEEAWDDKPSGCFLAEDTNIIYFNNNPIGARSDGYVLVCQKIEAEDVIVLPPEYDSRCPSSLEISKDDCEGVGLDVGGILQNDNIIEGSWEDRPSGCFFGPIIHYNTNPNGINDGRWHSICNKMKGVVKVSSKYEKCPDDKGVSKDNCFAAGLTVGGDQRGGNGSWNDRPSGCFMEEIGNSFIFFNRMINQPSNYFFIPFMDSHGNDIGNYSGGLDNYIKECDANENCVGFNSNGWLKHTLKDESQWNKWTDNPNLGFYVKKQEHESSENISLLCQWECPQSNSTQHAESFGCQCVDGYVSQETGQQVLKDDYDVCISALLSSYIHVTSRTITFSSKVVTEMRNKVLTQRAPANDILIDLTDKFSKKSSTNEDGTVEYDYTFSGLEPGHRYNAHFSYIDINGDGKNMTFPAVTSCSCSSDSDKTGPPKNLDTVQDNGHVMFSFEDDSLCEEAYSFTRTSYEDGNNKAISFTRDYFFIPKQACGSVIQPLTEASDNLGKSKLTVGGYYKYCVRAVHPILYMDHPFDYEGEGRTLLSSSDTCKDHKIKWESSILGKITTEPNAGLLPIKDVTVAYELLNEDLSSIAGCDECNGSTTTKQGGTFSVVFNIDNDAFQGKNDVEFPVKVTFNKSTIGNNNTSIEHQFLCNEGEDDCSGDSGTIIYLSHLQFREPLHVYDDTSVPFSGRISIADTDDLCVIANAEVCLINERNVGGVMKTNDTLVCGNTDPNGSYSLPVIIGSQVDYVDVMYHNHTFEPSLDSEFEPGTVIEADKYYHGMDFVDISKARLMVDVVGGLCNKNIGKSTVLMKVVGCDWEGMEKIQPATRGLYNNVPAHLLDVEVVEITDSENNRHDHIWKVFQGDRPLVRTIDLRSAGAADESIEGERKSLGGNSTTGIKAKDDIKEEEEKNLEAIAKEEEEDLDLVRFQYDGELQMDVSVFPDSLRCSDHPSTGGDSFHVLDYMKYFLVRVDLKYELIKDKVYCDIVDSELKLSVVNQVGVDGNEGFDDFYNSIGDDKTKAALTKCSDGCLYDIGHEVDEEGNLSSANVTDYFATGRPNIVAPFTKSMIFTIQGGSSDISHKADFVVEGYYSKGPGRSFALPTHKPIMILRDPPGGLSYATYENVVTTMKLETSSTSSSIHHKFGLGIKNIVNVDMDLCMGGGFGAIVLNCMGNLDSQAEIGLFNFEQNTGGIAQKTDETRSNQFSTTWSYQTSTDSWTAGAMSDVFVVPNLNVMYKEVFVVEWDNATCAVNMEDDGTIPTTITFNIEDTENQPALAFFSRYHVNKIKIPELQGAKESKVNQKDGCDCTDNDPDKVCKYFEADGTEKSTTCSEITNEIGSLQAGIDGWNAALKVEEDNLELATNDPSKSINNWFTEFGSKDMHSEESVLITDHDSSLAPPSLMDNKEALENELVEKVKDEPVKRIQFSGGGNTFSMTMNKEKVFNEVGLSDWGGLNVDSETSIQGPGLHYAKLNLFGTGIGFEANLLNLNVHVTHESTKGETDTEQTSIGFVLGDNDRQDEFVVDLFYDDQYGTVIFKTVAGQSKCPHEPNTAAIEDPRMVISSRPSQNVFPDEEMVFELEITNLGVGNFSSFMMYAQHRENEGGLQLMLDGAPFGESRDIRILNKDTTYKKILTVKRGPLQYEYTSLDLILRSTCDWNKEDTEKLWNIQEDEDNFLLKFVEPCPKVEWAGELNRDRHFIVNTNSDDPENLEVIVFNPSHGQSKFHDMLSPAGRLQNVFLYYREVGDLQWSKARTEITNEDGKVDSLTIDFAAEYAYGKESDYGYSTLKWALANKVPEGTYEIRVDAECDQLGGPADMDLSSTPILSGTIDLTRPEQYGRSLPLRESVLVGEEIAVVFTEPVRCEGFDLLITVDDIGVELDRNDPPIQIVCDGRKVGFQIDPTKINVEDWVGMSFTVEMGKINTATIESKSNVFDFNGNAIERNVKFEKKFANIDLDQASTSFTVTLNNMNHCSNVGSQMCSDEIKDKITTALMLNSSDHNRIQVESVSQASESTVSAKIKMLPTDNTGRRLRQSKKVSKGSASNTNIHAVGLFRELQKAVEEEQSKTRRLVVADTDSLNLDSGTIVGIGNMKILPSQSDMKLVQTDPDMVEEEEELYQYATMKGNAGLSQPVMSKVERQAMVEEIDSKSKSREEAMMSEIESKSKSREENMMNEIKGSKIREEAMMHTIERMSNIEDALFRELKETKEKSAQSELKVLHCELAVVTLACVGIALIAFLSLRRGTN